MQKDVVGARDSNNRACREVAEWRVCALLTADAWLMLDVQGPEEQALKCIFEALDLIPPQFLTGGSKSGKPSGRQPSAARHPSQQVASQDIHANLIVSHKYHTHLSCLLSNGTFLSPASSPEVP
jgi:hypothetical protein